MGIVVLLECSPNLQIIWSSSLTTNLLPFQVKSTCKYNRNLPFYLSWPFLHQFQLPCHNMEENLKKEISITKTTKEFVIKVGKVYQTTY